jgi:glycosyltransferase involved in cell wall biosynthesis
LKGLDYLLKALAEISTKRNIKLTVVGAPQKNGDSQKLIRQLGIDNIVEFTGRIDNQAFVRQYARAAVAVVPSVYEGFGLPAGPEVIGDAGLLVPPANSPALASAITSLLDNPERAKVMGKAGFERVQDNFTWAKAAEKTAQVYKEAIRDHRRF